MDEQIKEKQDLDEGNQRCQKREESSKLVSESLGQKFDLISQSPKSEQAQEFKVVENILPPVILDYFLIS